MKSLDLYPTGVYNEPIERRSQMKNITLSVQGMSCSACSNHLEKGLKKVDGLDNVSVNLPMEKVTFDYDESKIRLVDVASKVSKLGYQLVLEAQDDGEEAGPSHEEIAMEKAYKKMIFSAALSTLMMTLMVVHMFIKPIPGYFLMTVLLGFPVVFGTGLHVHYASFRALKNKAPNMDVLVSMGSLPPYLIGLLGFFFPIQTFIEMATTIMTFHLIGKYLEIRAKGRASQAIKKLIQMGAKTARIIIDGQAIEVPVKNLQVNDLMFIKPGEKIPTDGVIVEGESTIDESMATGESMPVKRTLGDEVIGSTLNKQGTLKVKVTKVGSDTFLSQVIALVEKCQGSKVPIQEFADRVTGYFVPTILVLTLLTFTSYLLFPNFHLGIISWGSQFLPWVNPDTTPLTLAFITATAVLVISCPCALGLGTPTALMVGSGIGAEKGILIRNGEAIQTLKDIEVIAFDKTGTLTKGLPEVTDVFTLANFHEKELIQLAASIEYHSEHPLAHAIMEKAKSLNVEHVNIKGFEAILGKGVLGYDGENKILVGNRKLMQDHNIDFSSIEENLAKFENEAKTAMIIAKNESLLGILAVADPIKPNAVKAIKNLQNMGIKTAMITGDNSRTAQAIARKIGIEHVISDVLPDGKVKEIKALQEKYAFVAMVGDGINDAPALKQANVGIAIGTGTDIAIEAADVTLVKGELDGIVTAVELSRGIFKKIKQNYFWAWAYNGVAIPFAMMGLLHPMIGAAAMAMSSLNVIYNSLRLKKHFPST